MSGQQKKHRQVLRDSIRGITKPGLQRVSYKAGVKSMSGLCYDELRGVLYTHLNDSIRASMIFTSSRGAKTVTLNDVISGLEQVGGDHLATSNAMKTKVKMCKN